MFQRQLEPWTEGPSTTLRAKLEEARVVIAKRAFQIRFKWKAEVGPEVDVGTATEHPTHGPQSINRS